MTASTFKPIDIGDRFQFQCHRGVPCFNHCCQDLNQALTPYDVLMVRKHLDLSWRAFKEAYAALHIGPGTGLTVVSLRFDEAAGKRCPFVGDQGCRVYAARPSSCRLYPLARAFSRSPDNGGVTEHFALLQEAHCRGFEQRPWITAGQWIADQQLAPFFQANDALLELIALKNRLGKGPLPPIQQQWAQMALYDLDALKRHASEGQLPGISLLGLDPPSEADTDEPWLVWGMAWIKQVLIYNLKP